MAGLRDGLGFEEIVNESGTGLVTQHAYITGSLTVDNQTSGANFYSAGILQGANTVIAGSADIPTVYDNTGSPYAVGNVVQLTAANNISGGMWITTSGANGASSAVVLQAGTVGDGLQLPLGVAVASVASGGTVNVLTRGIHYFGAGNSTITAGNPIVAGTARQGNQVLDHASFGAGTSIARGIALTGGTANTGTAIVYLF